MAIGSPKHSEKSENEPTAPRETVRVDSAEAHKDRVAMVSRDKNGNPDQSSDYELLVGDDASDAERKAAENKPADTQVD